MKKYIKLWWRSFLIFSIPISIILLLFSGLALDSESMIPAYIAIASGAWLLLLTIANDPYRGKGKDYENRITEDDFM